MKKNKSILLLLSFLVISIPLWSQEIDDSLLFIDSELINTHILYSNFNAEESFGWLKYNGNNEEQITNSSWKQVYLELTRSFFIPNDLPDLSELTRAAEREINENGKIPIMIMNYDYNLFKSNAIEDNLIELREGIFYDVEGREESPYDQEVLFVSAPFMDELIYEEITFSISESFYFSNREFPASLQIDFGDGNGFQEVNLGQDITINYQNIIESGDSTIASPSIKTRVIYDEIILESAAKVSENSCTGGFPAFHEKWDIIAEIPFSSSFSNNFPVDFGTGDYGRAEAYVRYGNGHDPGEIHKPIIFVEGIDFGRDFTTNISQNGDFGWCAFWGKDSDFVEFEDSPILLDQLLENGYDVFLLDFRDGADFIERNAMTLVQLLQDIQEQAAIRNPEITLDPSVVVGASMGGQVARYALAYMEQNNLKHCAREYISFDSPHKGANIPISLQKWVSFFANNGPGGGNSDAMDELNLKLDRPAAKELLWYHHTSNAFNGFATQERTSYQSAIDAIGYPNNLRKVAIANGSGNATTQPNLNPGDLLLETDWSPLLCLNAQIIKGDCYAMPNNLIFSGKAPQNIATAITCLALIPVGCNICVNSNISFDTQVTSQGGNLLPFDNAPGGYRNTALTIAEKFREDPPAPGATIDENPQGHPSPPNQCFIPTPSALDINTTDLLFNVNNISGLLPNENITPFEAIYVPFDNVNQKHVQLDDRVGGNMEWAINEILNTEDRLQSPLNSASLNGGVFNYGRADSRFLPGLVIGSGGQLHVNANLPTDYGSATLPLPPSGVNPPIQGSLLTMETCDCDNKVVEIADGGEFILGESSPNNKAKVIFHKGSTLKIKAGGKLIINDNSTLIIEPGAKLIYEAGAIIELLGDEAVLEIQGGLELGNNATFTFTYPNSTSGYVKYNTPFNPCATNPNWACSLIEAGNNTRIEFRGADKTDKVLEIAGDDMIIPDEVKSFRLHFGKAVFVTPESRLSLGSENYTLNDAIFEGVPNGRGVFVYGNSNSFIVRCDFDHVKVYGELFYGGNRLAVTASDFTNGAFVETRSKGVFLNNVDFDNAANLQFASFAGWRSHFSDLPSFYSNGTIIGNALVGVGIVTYRPEAGLFNILSFSSTVINSVDITRGTIVQYNGELSLKCSSVVDGGPLNHGIILHDNAQLRMSSIDGNGFNTISRHGGNIVGGDIGLIDIEMGYNDFTRGRIVGHFSGNNVNIPSIIGGNTNTYFDAGPATLDPNIFSDNFQTTSPKIVIYENLCSLPGNGGCNIIPVSWQFLPQTLPVPPCGNDNGDGGIFSNDTTSALIVCPSCPTINSEHFNNVPLNEAILTASTYMELIDPDQNDFQAIDLFHEILTSIEMNEIDYNQSFLINYAYSNMKNTLQNCFVTGRLEENTNSSNIHPSVLKFEEVLQHRIEHVNSENISDQFYLAIDNAMLYRLIGDRETSLNLLNEINNEGLSERQRQSLGIMLSTIRIESDVIEGLLPKEEAYKLYEELPRLEIILEEVPADSSEGRTVKSSQTSSRWFYPNPASTQLQLNLGESLETIRIYGVSGKELLKKQRVGVSIIDISELTTGIYTIERTNHKGEIFREQLIINSIINN